MTDPSPSQPSSPVRLRREPPRFRRVTVAGVARLGPRMVRVTLAGPELDGFAVDQPAASVRVLLPSSGTRELLVPSWNGNEFLLPDGTRPAIRTFTPGVVDPDVPSLAIDVVLHGSGVASEWAASVGPGGEAAVSGPGRGYAVDPAAPGFLLAGDETAIPAIGQLIDAIAGAVPVAVHVEVASPEGRLGRLGDATWHDLPPGAPPGDALVAAVVGAEVAAGTKVWVAGEAAAVQRIRRHLFEERGLARFQATVRGYWKHGRGGDPDDGD